MIFVWDYYTDYLVNPFHLPPNKEWAFFFSDHIQSFLLATSNH